MVCFEQDIEEAAMDALMEIGASAVPAIFTYIAKEERCPPKSSTMGEK